MGLFTALCVRLGCVEGRHLIYTGASTTAIISAQGMNDTRRPVTNCSHLSILTYIAVSRDGKIRKQTSTSSVLQQIQLTKIHLEKKLLMRTHESFKRKKLKENSVFPICFLSESLRHLFSRVQGCSMQADLQMPACISP